MYSIYNSFIQKAKNINKVDIYVSATHLKKTYIIATLEAPVPTSLTYSLCSPCR